MLVNGDAWEWFWDRYSSVTIDQHWPVTLAVDIPFNLSEDHWHKHFTMTIAPRRQNEYISQFVPKYSRLSSFY